MFYFVLLVLISHRRKDSVLPKSFISSLFKSSSDLLLCYSAATPPHPNTVTHLPILVFEVAQHVFHISFHVSFFFALSIYLPLLKGLLLLIEADMWQL